MTQSPSETSEESDRTVEIESFDLREIRAGNYLTITDAAEHASVRVGEECTEEWHIPVENAALEVQYHADGTFVPAAVIDSPSADGRRSSGVISIQQSGSEPPKHSLRVRLPNRLLTKLGVDPDDPIGERVEVFAGDNMIVFTPPEVNTISIGDLPDGELDPLELLGPAASEVFHAVEVERQHPATVAQERGVTVNHIIHTVREARKRLQTLIEEEDVEVDYDFDNPNVPDATDERSKLEIAADHPVEEFTDGELRATIHSQLTGHLQDNPQSDLANEVYEVVDRDADTLVDDPMLAAEAFVDNADRDELADIYLMLKSAGGETDE